ncbi:hypothetical protein [Phaeospirillum tilakii]|uniref:Tetratricopeptide repeat protein n=1 Tax=Phaeospirillum tilakii TaxID=741673 RepID=A0ABW5C948_9PROT
MTAHPSVPPEADPAALRARLAALRAAPATPPRALAQTLNELSGVLYGLNQSDEADRLAAEAVGAARAGMAEDPDATRFVLVAAEINHAGGRLRQGAIEDAAAGLATAADTFRAGGEAGRPFLGAMVEALHRAAQAFADFERWDLALDMRRRTVDLFGETPPGAAVQILALTLIQSAVGPGLDPARAVSHAEEATGLARLLRREGGETDQGLRLLLAQALGTLAGCRHRAGQDSSGLEAALEAVELLHALVPDNPLAAVPSLVATLESLGAILDSLGLAEQAASVAGQLATLQDSLARMNSAPA